jgi:superoxide reductase
MPAAKDLVQTADWKTEKHVPVIEAQDVAKKGEAIKVAVTVGKEIAHPNKTEHHIAWISLYFHPEGEKFPYCLGRYEFGAHGASAQGPDTSTIYSDPTVSTSFKTAKAGTLSAVSFCNIHGLWGSSKDIKVCD